MIVLITVAFDAIFVQRVPLIAAAREAADAVLAAAVLAHAGKVGALVDVLAVDVAVPLGTELFEERRARLGARVARVTPRFADRAAADALQVVAFELLGADAVTVFQVARLLALVDAAHARRVQRQAGRAGARERSFRIDTNAASFADARVQIAFVDVGARFAIDLRNDNCEKLCIRKAIGRLDD